MKKLNNYVNYLLFEELSFKFKLKKVQYIIVPESIGILA